MSQKRFTLLDAVTDFQTLSAARSASRDSDFDLCFICQEPSGEQLVCPATNSTRTDKASGYLSIAQQLQQFDEIGELSATISARISYLSCEDLVAKLVTNEAKFHKKCRNRYDKQHFERASKKRRQLVDDTSDAVSPPSTRARYSAKNFQPKCFFCDREDSVDNLTQAQTFELDRKVRDAASQLCDEKLLARLSEGDMIAVEALYHKTCLSALYNRLRELRSSRPKADSDNAIIEGIVLAEIVDYLKSSNESSKAIPVFKLSYIKSLYSQRLKEYGSPDVCIEKIHSTRLKEKILGRIPELHESRKGRDIILTFKKEIGSAIYTACKQDYEEDGICLSSAAKIVRKQILQHDRADEKGLLAKGCQAASVPRSLVTLIGRIIGGTDITDNVATAESKIALTISQLLQFNVVKNKRRKGKEVDSLRHSKESETPFPLYTGLLIHAKTRKKGIVNTFAQKGLSVSYERVQDVQLNVTKQLCKKYQEDGFVCPPSLREGLFTTAAVDNIDHNPSSTTAVKAFHGTSISIFQHPETALESMQTDLKVDIEDSSTKIELPESYTTLSPTKTKSQEYSLQTVNWNNESTHEAKDEMKDWLEHLMHLNEEDSSSDIKDRFSWSGFHSKRSASSPVKSTSTLLPLLNESVNSTAMLRHTMGVVKQILLKLNPQQAVVLTADQPVYALGKQVQWMYPEFYGESKVVMMMGALHIEMAFLNTIGDWLEGSGWVEILAKAEVNTPGRAESFLSGSQVKRTRYAHQVSCAALYLLLQEAFKRSESDLPFDTWLLQKSKESVQFKYWVTVMNLELILLLLVKGIRESNFQMFVNALEQIAPWMFSLDHTHYSRWLPIFINDMKQLSAKHPAVYEEFKRGHFTAKNSCRKFSSISEDQAHEQNNKLVKIDGGAIGILDNHISMMKWMVASPEISRLLHLFEVEGDKKQEDALHHEDTDAHEKRFRTHVLSFKNTFDEAGSPFEEEDILVHVVSRQIMSEAAATSVRIAYDTGKKQYDDFVQTRLRTCEVSIHTSIPKNKLPLFRAKNAVSTSKERLKMVSLKQDCKLFASLYVACQARDGDLREFFRHENHANPPSISEYGKLRQGTKADFLKCIENHVEARLQSPPVTAKILDGAAIVQMTPPESATTFGQYAQVFAENILKELKSDTLRRIDVVFDRYFPDSLKSDTREKRGTGARIAVKATTPICKNWRQFLRVSENKEELFSLLAKKLEDSSATGKIIVVTSAEDIRCSSIINTEFLSPSNQEEADTRIFLHAKHAAVDGHGLISIRTVDTDVVVIAIHVFRKLNIEELWVEFGTARNKRWLPIHEYVASLGDDVCAALPFWYAFTGCDTVSSFGGRGKKLCWDVWKSHHDVTDTFKR